MVLSLFKINSQKLSSYFLVFLCLLVNNFSQADPWVDTSNIYLRANIQYLADIGIISSPVTTFPLMWQDIAKDIQSTNLGSIDKKAKQAVLFVRHQLKLAKRNQQSLKLVVALEDKRFKSFGDGFSDKNTLQISSNFTFGNFAGKITTSSTKSPLVDGDNTSFDGSYGAFFLGNWVVSAGLQNRWWGPSWDSSLSLTANARTIPAISLSRKSAIPIHIPFTDLHIPWTMTTFMGQMNDQRIVDDTLLWGFRLTFKPTPHWEVGITRLAQWGGEGRPSDLSTFWKVLKGLDNCGGNGPSVAQCAAGEEPGNQMAGYDLRYANHLFSHPFSIYFTAFAEDGDRKGGLSILGEERYQLGFETQLKVLSTNWRLYLEGTDTYAQCQDGNNGDGSSKIGNCYYEHSIYQTGMRYKQRNIGSLYDNDATSFVLGAITQSDANTQFELKLRSLSLNQDNSDKAPENIYIGNTLTPIAEDVMMFSIKAEHSYRNWRYTLGADASRSTFENDLAAENNFNLFLQVEYNL
jgi:hypothetical protein